SEGRPRTDLVLLLAPGALSIEQPLDPESYGPASRIVRARVRPSRSQCWKRAEGGRQRKRALGVLRLLPSRGVWGACFFSLSSSFFFFYFWSCVSYCLWSLSCLRLEKAEALRLRRRRGTT
ncbi:unnamed protein product, partial [Ectocarpus sp. 12 AP-2014]